MSEQNKQRPEDVFQLVCEMLDKNEMHYEKNEKELYVKFGMGGAGVPMQFLMKVERERNVLRLLSPMPFVIQEDKRSDMLLAINIINGRLSEGNFDYQISSGRICFRIASGFADCEISAMVPDYLLYLASVVVKAHNEDFWKFSEGAITFEQLLSPKAE